tara:strand:+ start:361 stop:1764 length:1404 start_codon:yes stop_codon:yes gene_type:complete
MFKKISPSIILICISFILSILITNYYLKHHDKIIEDEYGTYHQMVKNDTLRYLSHGAEIKKDLDNEIDFFETGREHFTKYLPPRIAAAIFYFLDIDLFKDFQLKEINTGIFKPYLYFQCLVFYLSLIFFLLMTKKKFDNTFLFFALLFFALEPNIIQYHGTFWSESYFFSFQIIILALILSSQKNFLNYFFIGIFIGFLCLQKQYAIYYIFPIFIYYFIFYKKKIILNFSILLTAFFATQFFVGYNNLKRSGHFYFFANDNNIAIHLDLVPKVINRIEGYSSNEFVVKEAEAMKQWLILNSIKFREDPKNKDHYMNYRKNIINEKDKIRFDKEIKNRTINYFKEYPTSFVTRIIKNGFHIILLNPFHIYSDHNFVSGEVYYVSKKHDDLLKYRMIYTFVMYLICFIGFIYMLREKNYKLLTLLILSIMYFYVLSFWHGNTRYFMPVYIYFGFFFAKFFEIFYSKIKN